MLESILLVISLCMDTFVASFGYGTNKIKIPFTSVTVINLVCSGLLAISLFLGSILKNFLSESLSIGICFTILIILGVVRFLEGVIKTYLKKKSTNKKNIKFKLLDINFILDIYVDNTKADMDNSRILSPSEAFYLAIALGLDGIAVGFGSGLANINYIQVILFSLISDMVAVLIGCYLGRKLVEKVNLNLSWLSGLILIILAFMKLI
ncbi:MAG: sporulation membrane protein YtaF [Clostridium argentinense]|uniref:Sporulation membrane protein YtaF n=1 Tax=Clostridium faecium TaxID=2762223 RepID=A0ABR8YU01_9CLOT|nr:sporulation membrane protein YtaF [Clostridium faecium]MBD8047751.1 sporulation membrane protein YtaF [Clostridium faecium]MBS5824147.1 sporulation membrane protein YtaF [Clostridium argentinense]